jgi:hypothetical protein
MGRRIFNFLLLVAMLIGAAVTYDMKHKAEVAAAEVARLQAEIAKEKDAVALLKAEWSLLTQPGRLQSVVEKYADHFQLQPFSPSQIATIDEIPVKPIGAPDPLASSIARLAADETGKVK